MGQIVSFHPPKDGLVKMFEVVGEDGKAIWGGENPTEAIQWWRRHLNARLLVSAWEVNEAEEDIVVGLPIDLTQLVRALLAEVVG